MSSKLFFTLFSYLIILAPFSFSMNRDDHLEELLISNPAEASAMLYQKRVQFCADKLVLRNNTALTIKKSTKQFTKLIKKYEQDCPIFLIGECSSNICPLSRMNNPHARHAFEEKSASLILNKIKQSEIGTTVHYTSFASCCCLSELIILTNVLKKLRNQPSVQLQVNFIDKVNAFAIVLRDLLLANNNSESQYYKLLKQSSKKITQCELFSLYNIEQQKNIVRNAIQMERLYQQFLIWLSSRFPHVNVTLSIYDSTAHYLAYCEQPADVVTACDFEDDNEHSNQAVIDYEQLCYDMLWYNSTSRNICLSTTIPKNLSADPVLIQLVRQDNKDGERDGFMMIEYKKSKIVPKPSTI